MIEERAETGWHLSISAPNRYPTWDEIAAARYQLLSDDLYFVMGLPQSKDYVNLQTPHTARGGNVFHLWQVISYSDHRRIVVDDLILEGLR